jgi:Fe2+ or Zn2+ uptake regulation protein
MTRPATLDLHQTIEQRLHAVSQRYTRQRRRLVEGLQRAAKPLSIADMLKGSTRLPQSSVYRNLAALEQAGVVRRVVTEGEFGRYELAEDLTEHHHHVMCSSCGRVEDITIPKDLEQRMDTAIDRVARETGFASVNHRFDLIGTCGSCASSRRVAP